MKPSPGGAADSGSAVRWSLLALLAATSTIVGLQVLRAAQPQIAFLLRDRFGWPSPIIGLLALLVFTTGFSVAPLVRHYNVVSVLALVAGALGLTRLGLALWHGDPVGDLVLAVGGSACFFVTLGLLLAVARSGRRVGAFHLAFGLLLGVTGDLIGLAMPGSILVPASPSGWPAEVPSFVVLFVHLVGLSALCRRVDGAVDDLPLPAAWSWVAIGPYFVLQTLVFANPARVAATFDSPSPPWVVLISAPLVAFAGLLLWRGRGHPRLGIAVGVMALGLIAVALDPWPAGALALFRLWCGGLLASLLISIIMLGLGSGPASRPGFRSGSLAHGSGMIVWALLGFMNNAAFDVALPFDPDRVVVLAAVLLGFGALAVAHHVEVGDGVSVSVSGKAVAMVGMIGAAVVVAGAWPVARPWTPQAPAWPARILSYNLHCGVSPAGAFDLEAMARTIEAADADLVALQEVTRGWAANGAADMAAWLGTRLGLSVRFHGTADPTWGNAILGRWQESSHHQQLLPSDGLLIGRGALAATYASSTAHELRLIATHLHHPKDGGSSRLAQARALIELWGGRPRTVIVGDFNALPEAPEIAALRDAGLVDAFAEAGVGQGFTFRSTEPFERIDYVWLSPDLTADEVRVVDSVASDHLPLLAVIRPR